MRYRYIAVEGPPGAGKSALSEKLGARLEAAVVLESGANPFLRDFYLEREGAAFQAQMFFLLSRYRQLSDLAQRDLFHQVTICDFLFARDKIFAYLNLDDTELMLYEKIYTVLVGEVPGPELVIYLQSSADALLKRLRGRSRKGEPAPGESYLRELVRAYDYFFYHYSATPLLVVNATRIDFSAAGAPIEDLMREIEVLTGGTRYFKPAEPL